MNLIDSIGKTVMGMFGIRPTPPPYIPTSQQYIPQQQQQSQPPAQTAYYNAPAPKTPKERLIELNPAYANLHLSPEQIQAHLVVEERLAREKAEKEKAKQEADAIFYARKQRAAMLGNQMQQQYSQEYNRQMKYQNELALLENKYQQYQQPVRFNA